MSCLYGVVSHSISQEEPGRRRAPEFCRPTRVISSSLVKKSDRSQSIKAEKTLMAGTRRGVRRGNLKSPDRAVRQSCLVAKVRHSPDSSVARDVCRGRKRDLDSTTSARRVPARDDEAERILGALLQPLYHRYALLSLYLAVASLAVPAVDLSSHRRSCKISMGRFRRIDVLSVSLHLFLCIFA